MVVRQTPLCSSLSRICAKRGLGPGLRSILNFSTRQYGKDQQHGTVRPGQLTVYHAFRHTLPPGLRAVGARRGAAAGPRRSERGVAAQCGAAALRHPGPWIGGPGLRELQHMRNAGSPCRRLRSARHAHGGGGAAAMGMPQRGH